MVLCTDVGLLKRFSFCIVGAVVMDAGEMAEEIVDLKSSSVESTGLGGCKPDSRTSCCCSCSSAANSLGAHCPLIHRLQLADPS